nr:MAG TPA: hypothetical protein [Caudoviricetes sp.]
MFMSKNKTKFKYTGIKLLNCTNQNRLTKIFNDKHITLEFFDKTKTTEEVINTINNLPLGKLVCIKVTEYGRYKNENTAANVIFVTREIDKLFTGKIPHITLNVKHNGKAVNSYKCFTGAGRTKPLVKTLYLWGEIGYFDYNNNFYTEPIK